MTAASTTAHDGAPAQRRTFGLRTWLAMLVAATLLPLTLWSVHDATRDAVDRRTLAGDRLEAFAAQRGARVGVLLQHLDHIAATASVTMEPLIGDRPRAAAMLARIGELSSGALHNIALLAPDGRMVAASHGTRDAWDRTNQADQRYFNLALREAGSAVEVVANSSLTGQDLVIVARPILDARGKAVGVVAVSARTAALEAHLDAPSVDLAAASVAILDERGTRVAVAGRADADAVMERCRAAAQGGREGRASTGAEPWLVAVAAVPETRWHACAVLPWQPGRAALWADLHAQLGVIALTLLVAALLAGLFGRRIVGAVHALEEGARRLVAGEPGYRVALGGPAETRLLATEFNRMADVLAAERNRLVESEQRWQFALEGARAGVWDWHVPSGRLWVSHQWQAMLGLDAEPFAGTVAAWEERLHPDERAEVLECFAECARDEAPFTIEHRQRHEDGSWRWIEARAMVIERDAAGAPVRIIGTDTDVTTRKNAERARRDAEERWKFALEGAGDGVWDWSIPSGRVFYSRRWSEMLGYAEHEIEPSLRAWDSRIHPDDRPAVFERVQAHLAGETPVYESEHRVQRRDGSWCWVRSRGKVVARDAAGEATRMIGTHSDLTARREAEAALREAEARWQFALESAGQGVWDWNIATGQVYRSPRHLEALGYAPGELADTHEAWIELLHPDDATDTVASLYRHLSGAAPEHAVQYRLRHRDGHWVWCEARARVVQRDPDGRPLRLIGAIRDVSAERAAVAERERLIAERAEVESRLRLALDRAPIGVLMNDTDARITYWNEACEQMFGYSAEEAIGRSSIDLFVPPEARAYVESIMARLREGDVNAHGLNEAVRKDGRRIVTEWRNTPIVDAAGRVTSLLAMVIDVTERIDGEHERMRLLADKERLAGRLQRQFERMPIACIVRDAAYRVVEVNPAAERLFGWSLADLAGRDMLDILVAEDDRSMVRSSVRQRLAAGEQAVRLVNRNVTRDGRELVCEWHTVQMPDGEHVLSMALDITERTRAEEAIRESEARYRGLLEVAPDGVVVLREGRIQYANEAMARIARVERPLDLVGREFLPLFATPERAALAERFARLAEEIGPGSSGEHQILSADGSVTEVDMRAASYRWKNEVYLQAIVRDNTARKLIHRRVLQINVELERRVTARTEELEAANRELEAFSYSVAHDLRAPLRAIDGYARILAEDLGGAARPATVDRSITRIRANIARMSQLIDDLLAYARVGRRELEVVDVDLGELVRAVVDEVRGAYPDSAVEIGALPTVSGDATLLRQAFANLIANALKFSAKREAPAVRIECEGGSGEVVCCVRDNGVGFSMEYAHKLFGMFQRLHAPNEFEGTGVGLAIVQRAVQRHGGRVWAESEPERGAAFFLALPTRQ